jgi:hypothetical protein
MFFYKTNNLIFSLWDNITSMNLSIDSIMVSNKLFVADMERGVQIAMSAKDVTTQITTCITLP